VVLGEDIPRGDPLQLAFAEPMHGFLSLEDPWSRDKRPNPQPWMHTAFHPLMILCDHMIPILTPSERTAFQQRAVVFAGIERQGVRGVLVHGDDARKRRVARIQSLPKHCSAGSASRLAPRMTSSVVPVESTARSRSGHVPQRPPAVTSAPRAVRQVPAA
jgi:hypothetical protein